MRLAHVSILLAGILAFQAGAAADSHKAIIAKADAPRHFGVELSEACGPRTACDLDAFMRDARVCALVVLKDRKIRMLEFNSDSNRCVDEDENQGKKDGWKKLYGVASVAKSITSTLLGVAIAGKSGAATPEAFEVELSRPVAELLPELRTSGYARIPVDLVLRMRSGIRWRERGKNNDGAKMDKAVKEPKTRDKTYVEFAKTYRQSVWQGRGSFNYKAIDSAVVGLVAENYLDKGRRLPIVLEEKIWRKLGTEADATWAIDRAGSPAGSCCLKATVGDLARFGQMVLDRGANLNGDRLVPSAWFDIATRHHAKIDDEVPKGDSYIECRKLSYRHQWWLFPAPRKDFTAWGIDGQFIHVFPDDKVVVVQISQWPRNPSNNDLPCATFAEHDLIVEALRR